MSLEEVNNVIMDLVNKKLDVQLKELKEYLQCKLENPEEVLDLIKDFQEISIKSNKTNSIDDKNVKKEKNNNNETYGISAEVALCQVYDIDRDKSYNGRYNQRIVDKFIPVLEKFKTDNPNIIVTESCGHTGGKVDFKATINSVENQSETIYKVYDRGYRFNLGNGKHKTIIPSKVEVYGNFTKKENNKG